MAGCCCIGAVRVFERQETRAPRLYVWDTNIVLADFRIGCMAEKYQNKYRVPSARLANWDYSLEASYFVTICTQSKEHYFGQIVNDELHLSEIGELVQAEWLKTPLIRADMNLTLGAFVVMPNHFHAIITIGENNYNTQTSSASPSVSANPEPVLSGLPAYKNMFVTQSKNLAAVIGGFKSAVTRQARKLHADFAWQSRYHDHIIRDNRSYQLIEDYIWNNPSTWKEDMFFG